MRKKLAVVAAFVCIGAGVMGTGIAHAAPTYVVSDKVVVASSLVPSTPPGTFGFEVRPAPGTCSLTSDGELKPYACRIVGLIVPKTTGGLIGFAISSSDGSTSPGSVALPLVQVGVGSYTFKGQVTEKDSPEKGVVPLPYPAVVSGTAKITGTSIAVTATVKELLTQP